MAVFGVVALVKLAGGLSYDAQTMGGLAVAGVLVVAGAWRGLIYLRALRTSSNP